MLKKRIRQSFGRIESVAEIPNLIQVQKKSYEDFLQFHIPSEKRAVQGFESVLRSIFPISDYDNRAVIEYVKYEFENPKYDIEECIQRGVSYAAPIKATMRLIIWDIDEETSSREIKSIKEQDVYIGEMPLMTENGTFIINGAQRVIISQLHRSPGVFYYHDDGRNNAAGKFLYSARIIPYRGSWLDFEFDIKDVLYFRIDRRRKIYITTLLRALGLDSEKILEEFYSFKTHYYKKSGDYWVTDLNMNEFKGTKLAKDLINDADGKVLIAADTRVTPRMVKQFEDKNIRYRISNDDLLGKFIAKSLKYGPANELKIDAGAQITLNTLELLKSMEIDQIDLLEIDNVRVGPYIRNTLFLDKNLTKVEALTDIYKVLRPGDPSTPEAAENLFINTFFDSERYDLSAVGRMKMNAKHRLDISEDLKVLTKDDIISVIKHLVFLKDTFGEADDIDSLANRRVRSVGELVENQFRIGLIRLERSILERMSAVEIDAVMPHDLMNSKVLISVIREFFGTSQLSQFMDQTNPLSEVTHKRRVSALGPGGLMRTRAGFEVRDVHQTHYGRICPIETPEGQNIGLINSLATYARVNRYGFIESPYRKIQDGKVTNQVDYLSAIDEAHFTIAHANAPLTQDGVFVEDMVTCRQKGEFTLSNKNEIHYMDVSPKQLVSVAASLIPFLENNDANRALMGSNMQRQAVPLVVSEAPLVGTGMEAIVVRDSGVVVIAKRDGVVEQVDATRIVIRSLDLELDEINCVDIYTLIKYRKSNQGTCINQKPIVKVGEVVKKGDIIADGPSTDLGELALGHNVLVAFMPWNGYNFEDSILISERLVQNDKYTSIHIEEFEVVARDTRLGPESITCDIPNVSDEALANLDESGIIYIGAKVKPGDILVGKVTPKSEAPLTPEEKLLRAIFGEKAADVRDSSLRLSSGIHGTIVGVRIFTRRGVDKDERAIVLERIEIDKFSKDKDDQVRIIQSFVEAKASELLLGKAIKSLPKQIGIVEGKLSDKIVNSSLLSKLSARQLWQVVVDDKKVMSELEKLKSFYDKTVADLESDFKKKIEKIQSGDNLPQGALKVVKVYVARKLKLQPGDKMAGRHGNKGVVSKIIPVEDMPFLEDGTPVDIVLNPLGVPSRMNIGQIIETHLGWASANLGKQISVLMDGLGDSGDLSELREKLLHIYDKESDLKAREAISTMTRAELKELGNNLRKGVPFATPVFDGAKENDVNEALTKAGVDTSGQVRLIDGRTGEYFERNVTVGYLYMLKLDHLVESKIHARSIGPYSLVTQQPLGGKSHFGGQRFGEMECWALEAYGAAYTLQEMLTVKSDDVSGRVKIYESIVRGDPVFDCSTPESFNVMVKELRALAFNIEMIEYSGKGAQDDDKK